MAKFDRRLDTERLIDVFSHPLDSVSQLAWTVPDPSSNIVELWGGSRPLLDFQLETPGGPAHFLCGTSADRLRLALVGDDELSSRLPGFIAELSGSPPDGEWVGMFKLDSAVLPDADWHSLVVRRLSVLSHVDDDSRIIGFVLSIALDVQLGVFVPPNDGVTIVFNDTCKRILRRAEYGSAANQLKRTDHVYQSSASNAHVDDVDWFAWLQQ
jgi:hypothetical protein